MTAVRGKLGSFSHPTLPPATQNFDLFIDKPGFTHPIMHFVQLILIYATNLFLWQMFLLLQNREV